MKRRLIAAVALALSSAPVVVAAAPTARAADSCTPTISMDRPFQDPGGMAVFGASFNLCAPSLVTVKLRDRDVTPVSWGGGAGTEPAGPGSTWSGTCHPDGQPHRWVAYATVKTPTGGTLLAESAKVYLNAAPVIGNCAPYPAPDTCPPTLEMTRPFQAADGYVYFPTDYSACDTSRIQIKVRDRDDPNPQGAVFIGNPGPFSVGAGTQGKRYTAWCIPDGKAHRYAAYATMKTPDGGTLILRTEDIYYRSTPVTSCGPFSPPPGL